MRNNYHLTDDLKDMKPAQLRSLAEEIRQTLIETVSENGGHLASNLGIVELTIALHSVFESPKDQFVFDVGHQAYVHKLLTGRADKFSTLRQKDGLSGFPSIRESAHDSFTAGHASTAISAALGLARARDLRGDNNHVVAIVGDGALTGGQCYEALNDAGNTRLIIILNDNEMSIARNVGSLSVHLGRLRQSASYLHAKSTVRQALEKVPRVGRPTIRIIERIRDALKTFLVSDRFFESLGINYVGPIDGHSFPALFRALNLAKKSTKPVVLHVVTQKGRGYLPAQEHPERYHGLSPKNSANEPGTRSAGSAACETLMQYAEADSRICTVVAAMPTGTAMQPFFAQFPNRSFDVGIAEPHAVEMAAGLAAGGMRPFVAIYSTFLQRAIDQIAMDVCLPNLPVTFLLDRAGLVGEDGATHQGVFDLTYLRQMPGMHIGVPASIEDLRTMLSSSLSHPGPMAIRYPKALPANSPVPYADSFSAQLVRKGSDVLLLTAGPILWEAMVAAEKLAQEGISVTIVDARYVKPLDTKTLLPLLASVRVCFTAEENTAIGGFSSAIMELCAENHIRTPIVPIAVPDRFILHGTIAQQRAMCGLDSEGIASTVRIGVQSL